MAIKEFWIVVQTVIAAMGGWLGWFLGGLDGFLYALIIFVIVDYITGIMVAIINKELSSEIGARGIFKKILIFILVGIAHIIDSRLIGEGSVIRTAVIFFYLSNEGISIIENSTRIGLPVPQKLKDVLAQLHGKSKGEDENGTKR
ncbi:phage holin family protein [Bacillus sp. MB2021]|jgi:toxin secretion/phage lysis holin|uniref:phage holin family protein n=1 Tax=Bacillus sp. MB2021 TaxID=1408303 RepID=UPI000A8210AA|nr:phage holin family protein [Bacillus sp. MB2021]